MSWLISLLLASSILTSESNIPVQSNYQYTNSETTKIISLDETERFEQTYPLSATGRVSVSNVNGSITIDTWDNNQVKLEAVKTADSKERMTEVEIKIDASSDSFSVKTEFESWKNRGSWTRGSKLVVDYRLTVPKTAVLAEIETVNGSITIANAANSTNASAVNGTVRGTNLRGAANLSTVNGTVLADFERLATGSKISLNTVNGQVNLTLPSDINATVKADTVNGTIVNDFGLPVRKGQYVGRDLYGKIGSGEASIRLNSVNGGLSIKRKNDGKSPNPVVNLLPPKGEQDDTDSEDDEDSLDALAKIDVDKMNKNIAKAQKDAEKSYKEAEKEFERMAPEIEKATEEAFKQSAEVIKKTNEYINSEEVQKRFRDSQRRQREAFQRMYETSFSNVLPTVFKNTDTIPVKGVPRVTIEAADGNVSVRGWDRSEVQYTITQLSRQKAVKQLDLKVERSESDVKLKIDKPKDKNCDCYLDDRDEIRLEVFVPKKSNLRIVAEGEIRLENISGNIDVRGADDAINIRDADGRLTVANEDGRIRVIGFKGEIDSQTIDGEMSLEGDFQKLSAETVDGTIILTLPADTNASLETTAENVETQGFAFTSVNKNKNMSVYKIGKGGNLFRIAAEDGTVLVRSSSELKTVY